MFPDNFLTKNSTVPHEFALIRDTITDDETNLRDECYIQVNLIALSHNKGRLVGGKFRLANEVYS